MEKVSDELKPCPFCGGGNQEVYANDWTGDSSTEEYTGVVDCECGCMVETEEFDNEVEAICAAIAAWNRRAES